MIKWISCGRLNSIQRELTENKKDQDRDDRSCRPLLERLLREIRQQKREEESKTDPSLWRGDFRKKFQERFHSTQQLRFTHSSSAEII
jgi:hypothetical protein